MSKGFCTPVDAELPRMLVHIGQPRTHNLETALGPPMQPGRAQPLEHTNGVKAA
jgi:hypothetical protein